MNGFSERLDAVMRTDFGGRGLPSFVKNPMDRLSSELGRARSVLLFTGFPVKNRAGETVCETDGPLGCADMAKAFASLDIPVCAVTDPFAAPVVDAALESRGAGIKSVSVTAPEEFRALVLKHKPSHFISIERPGRTADGHYYSMRGRVLDGETVDCSAFPAIAREGGAVFIAIGDGGNELGMGSYREAVFSAVPNGRLICAEDAADIALAAGISNFWGWGIAALLSRIAGKDLLPTPKQAEDALLAAEKAGSVDGCTGLPDRSVDSVPLTDYLSVLEKVRAL